jgi:5-methyltetrahydropteroyltriglutamate--homocysteine methyltransferase
MPLPPGVYRADQVGSLLRPAGLRAARAARASGALDAAGLRAEEDRAIGQLVRAQLRAGLRAVTDGEARRRYFHLDFLSRIGGIGQRETPDGERGTLDGQLKKPPVVTVTGRLAWEGPVAAGDFAFLRDELARAAAELGVGGPVTPKVCVPSPTMVHFRGGRGAICETAYPDLEVFFDDLAAVYRKELRALYEAGARFVQLDDTNLAYLCDEEMRAEVKQRDDDPDELPRRYAVRPLPVPGAETEANAGQKLINAAIADRPKDLVIGIHLCRGNYRSRHFASGGYAPVAEALFRLLDVDVYFLEYDDARSGDFEPLRMLPAGKTVVLGLMGSKQAALDDRARIEARLREAAGFCAGGLAQVCLSHQCGFSSTEEGNELGEAEQWAKIGLEVEIARGVWGEDLSK